MPDAVGDGPGGHLAGRELRLTRAPGRSHAFAVVDGERTLGELHLSKAKEGLTALNTGEATTDAGTWRLHRPVAKLRPRVDVTDKPTGSPVATYRSKVFGDGEIEIEGGETYRRRGNPLRGKFRIETRSGETVLEIDGNRALGGGAPIHIGHSGVPTRDLILLVVISAFVALLYQRMFVPVTAPRGSG